MEDNEIVSFVEGRYVSAIEACWRIFGFPLHSSQPCIVRLNVHLEGQEQITINRNADAQAVARKLEASRTPLEAWFKLNEEAAAKGDTRAPTLLYQDVPAYYVWDPNGKFWRPRKRQVGRTIGRMYFAHPNQGERYYLRLLLTTVRGATSFKDLKRPPGGGEPLDTFMAAAVAWGLAGTSFNTVRSSFDQSALLSLR